MKRSFRTVRAAELVLAVFLSACEETGPTVPFKLGQTIPVGEWSLRVRQPEVVSPKVVAGFHDLGRSNATSKVIAVHLVLEPKDPAVAESPKAMEQAVVKLMAGCGLEDGEGKRYPIGFPVPDSQFRLMKSGGMMTESEMKDYFFSGSDTRIPKDWVVLYSVPQDRSDFTLLIRNFFPLEGQPHIATVDLGR